MENRVRAVRSDNRQGAAMEGVKFASDAAGNTNRRALRDIKNIIGASNQHLAVSKRGLQEKPSAAAVDAKNHAFAGHRPVTRKFAAALATQPSNAPLEERSSASLEFSVGGGRWAGVEEHRSCRGGRSTPGCCTWPGQTTVWL